MTSRSLAQLNRRIDMLSRSLRGDPAIVIAQVYEVTHQCVSRILTLARRDERIVRAAEALKAQRERALSTDEPTRQERALEILRREGR